LGGAATDREAANFAATIAWRSGVDGSRGTGGRLDIATLRSGTRTIAATVIDAGGKRATAAITVVVNAAPTVAITAPTAGSSFVPGEPVRLGAAASDAEDGNLNAGIQWTSSLDGPLGTGAAVTVDTLRSGTHVIRASVADRGGKTASTEVTVVVNAPPAVAVASPSDGATFVPGEAVRLEGTATDAE